MAAKPARAPMSAAHKAALAEGRNQGRAVRRYLEALERDRPRRGRRRTPATIQRRLDAISSTIATADPVTRLQLVQERLDLTAELESTRAKVDRRALEDDFVRAAGPYSERKGISYAAWRELDVDPSVLRRAGITRSTRS
jgi:uncharacterized protein YicC (UPF0701 family)